MASSNKSFKSMGLCEEVLKAIDKLGFKYPTPIQRQAIPTVMTGVDSIALARTGSGKTGAFAIPTIDRLRKHNEIVGARAIVLSPTRELAMQTCKVFQLLARHTDLRIALIVGGHSMDGQFDRLMNNPDIIIATPGRLVHHLEQGAGFGLDRVEILIFDEADRLYEMGFSEQIQAILKSCPSNRQVLLFSATLPSQLVSFARAGLQNPTFIRLDSECTLSDQLELSVAFTRSEAKSAALISLLRALRTDPRDIASVPKTIVFGATRHHVDYLGQLLAKANVAPTCTIYGSMEQQSRQDSLSKFRNGYSRVLIVTDVAARGLDIPDVDIVIHYDFPCSPKLFIHRTGRTARAGKSGKCISMVTQSDLPYLMDVVMFLGAELRVAGKQQPIKEKSVEDGLCIEVETDAARTIEIGSVPFVDDDVEMVARLLEEDTDLQSGKKSMEFAMGPYYKTRPSASKHAVRRGKEFVDTECGGQQALIGCGMSLFESLGNSSGDAFGRPDDILQSLRSFRPTQAKAATIGTVVRTETRRALEDKIFGGKRARDLAYQILEQQREEEGGVVSSGDDSEHEVVSQTPTRPKKIKPAKTFKSAQFYHDGTRSTNAFDLVNSMDEHRLDLVPETEGEMAKARFAKKWDKRKMKYVTMRVGADGKAIKEKRNESGRKLSEKDNGKNLYKDWVKKTKKQIPKVGEIESAEAQRAGKKLGFEKPEETERKPKYEHSAPVSTPKAVKSKQYTGEVPWQYLTNKQKRLETRKMSSGGVTSRGNEKRADTLKTPTAIAKARKLKDTRQALQNVKKRQEFHLASREAFAKKQQGKIAQRAAPKRSWAKQKGGSRR